MGGVIKILALALMIVFSVQICASAKSASINLTPSVTVQIPLDKNLKLNATNAIIILDAVLKGLGLNKGDVKKFQQRLNSFAQKNHAKFKIKFPKINRNITVEWRYREKLNPPVAEVTISANK